MKRSFFVLVLIAWLFCSFVCQVSVVRADYQQQWGNQYEQAGGDVKASPVYSQGVRLSDGWLEDGWVLYRFFMPGPAEYFSQLDAGVRGVDSGILGSGADVYVYNWATSSWDWIGKTEKNEGLYIWAVNPTNHISPSAYNYIIRVYADVNDCYDLEFVDTSYTYNPPFDFAVSATPYSRTITAGDSTTYSVAVTLEIGSPQLVSLICSGLPSGASYSFNPSSGNPTFISTLTVYTTASTPSGTYTLTITGSGGGKVRWNTVQLIVIPHVNDIGILPKLQHKDTMMLCLEGCSLTGDHAWDDEHQSRGCLHDNWYCVRASISMINAYYGGHLSQDRISFYVIHERNHNTVPENDLGHGRGFYSDETSDALSWALNGATIIYQSGKPTFAQITGWIDSGRPILRRDVSGDWHATVIDGYEDAGQMVHVIDPWTGTESSVAYSTLAVYEAWIPPAGATARSDESSVSQDSDGDGVIDFDEIYRFGTDPYTLDTDGDLVPDKQEIMSYTFLSDGSFDAADSRKPDSDSDGLRCELDVDSDNGGISDGLEDINRNGRVDPGETDPLNPSDDPIATPPVADFTYSPLNPTTSDTIIFYDASWDSDGTVVAWQWNFGDGWTSNQQNPTHKYDNDGAYTVTLTVTDNDGLTDGVSKPIAIENVAPSAYIDDIHPDPSIEGEPVYFSGHGTDPDGSIVKYRWDSSIDGFLSDSDSFSTTSLSVGTHTISFKVQDDDDAWSSSDTETLTIETVALGYHFVGAETSQINTGISAEIEVTDPDVQRGTWNFLAAWIMVFDRGVLEGYEDDRWIQVGWAEKGEKDDRQYVFTYDTQHNEWFYYTQYSISPSMSIQVNLTFEGGTTWAAWLWWNDVWVLLDEADVGFSSPPNTAQCVEAYIAEGLTFYIPDTTFHDARLLVSGEWHMWDTTYDSTTFYDEPYRAYWEDKYWNWYVHYGWASKLSVMVESPVNLLVTDPNGFRIGYDFENGIVVNEIPDATYSGPGSDPEEIVISNPIVGSYIIEAFGTNTGPYTITLESVASDEAIIDIQTWQGTAAPGEVHTEIVDLDEDGELTRERIYINPSPAEVAVGHSVTVEVNVANVADLYTWEMNLCFNGSLVNCTDVWYPDYHVFAGKSFVQVAPTIEQNYVRFGACLLGSQPGFTGNGTLCLISFVGLEEGNCPLQFKAIETFLLDSDLNDIPFAMRDGVITTITELPHDLAITNVTFFKTVVGQGCSMNITVAVENQGYYTENFNVTAYANTTEIQSIPVTLPSGNSTTLTFAWNTTGFAIGIYTISANATIVQGEIDLSDNTLTDGSVTVACLGDLTGPEGVPDGTVNMRDISLVAKGFGANLVTDSYSPKYGEYWHETSCDSCPHSANCDLTGPTPGLPDGTINMRDISLVASLFGTGGC